MAEDLTYRIVRKHSNGDEEEGDTGLTLEEAQDHCNDPETSHFAPDGSSWMDIYFCENPSDEMVEERQRRDGAVLNTVETMRSLGL